MGYVQSKEVLNEKGQQYHIACKKGHVGRYVLLPGDPFRTDAIASLLDGAHLVAHNREHRTWTGKLDGVDVSVTSTGMGGPSAAIALEELIHCGADTFIRVGTCGRICADSFEEGVHGVIVTGAVRDEGTSRQYIPIEYPAVADRAVVEALARAAADLGHRFTEGLCQSKDSFYGQHDPDSMPEADALHRRWKAWEVGHVMASEMETAALFIVSSIRGCRTGAILAYETMNGPTLDVACLAIKHLIAADLRREKAGGV